MYECIVIFWGCNNMNKIKSKAKSIDELYSDYKLFYTKCLIEMAKTKYDLFDALKEISMSEVCKREDLFNDFKKKAIELGIYKNECLIN